MSARTILVVDDEEDILQFLRLVLGERGYTVVTAADGADALTQAQIHRPDLVLLDVMMPDMDGWEVLKVLRSDEETSGLPVAMLSARSEARDRMQGLREGAADYICKPFSLEELFAKIEAIVGPGAGGEKAER
jgi:DNA-binding response OmpR family regulator